MQILSQQLTERIDDHQDGEILAWLTANLGLSSSPPQDQGGPKSVPAQYEEESSDSDYDTGGVPISAQEATSKVDVNGQDKGLLWELLEKRSVATHSSFSMMCRKLRQLAPCNEDQDPNLDQDEGAGSELTFDGWGDGFS